MFCRISFILNHFTRNKNGNRLVLVTFEFVIICNQNDTVTKSVFLKKLKKTRACDKFKIVTIYDRHKCHTLSVTGTNPFSFSVWNPDWNGSVFCFSQRKEKVWNEAALAAVAALAPAGGRRGEAESI